MQQIPFPPLAPNAPRSGNQSVNLPVTDFIDVIMRIQSRSPISKWQTGMIGQPELASIRKSQYGSGRLMKAHVCRTMSISME